MDNDKTKSALEQIESGIKYANYRWQEWGERAIESFTRITEGAEALRAAVEGEAAPAPQAATDKFDPIELGREKPTVTKSAAELLGHEQHEAAAVNAEWWKLKTSVSQAEAPTYNPYAICPRCKKSFMEHETVCEAEAPKPDLAIVQVLLELKRRMEAANSGSYELIKMLKEYGCEYPYTVAEAPRPSAPNDKLLALVKASVHLAILRHDLGDDDMDIDAILEDTANAVRGIDTCAEEPIQEWTAVAESRPSAEEVQQLVTDILQSLPYYDSWKKYRAEFEKAITEEVTEWTQERITRP